MPRGDLDAHPKDGVVSLDELADALRIALGPFRVEAGKLAGRQADALFERLDTDKDGNLARPELADASSTLHKLDLDDDELIDGGEIDPFADPAVMQEEDMLGSTPRRCDNFCPPWCPTSRWTSPSQPTPRARRRSPSVPGLCPPG